MKISIQFLLLTVLFLFIIGFVVGRNYQESSGEGRIKNFQLPGDSEPVEGDKYECDLYSYSIEQPIDNTMRIGLSIEAETEYERSLTIRKLGDILRFSTKDFFNDPIVFDVDWEIKKEDEEQITATFFVMNSKYTDGENESERTAKHQSGLFMLDKTNGRALLLRGETWLEDEPNGFAGQMSRTLYFICN